MHRNAKGFTLMELMVVIVIVAILAAVAVPLYINYVKDAQRTDARAVIGAVITAQQSFYLKSPSLFPGTSPTYSGDLNALVTNGFLNPGFQADVIKRWGALDMEGDATSFRIRAVSPTDESVWVQYSYTQDGGGDWTP